jgi:CMP/dCMP kinase
MPDAECRMPPIVIAIDGPSASGKGTIAKKLAAHFGFAYLDTGLLYRAVGLGVVRTGGDPSDPAAAEQAARALANSSMPEKLLADPELRGDKASNAASRAAAHAGVRAALLKFQKDFCAHPPGGKGAVLDGRDIGTVVCPEADAKVFLTAVPEARAMRRFKELQGSDSGIIYERVLQDMKARDTRDSGREAAPLARAAEALELDSTALDEDAAFAAAVAFVARRLESRQG